MARAFAVDDQFHELVNALVDAIVVVNSDSRITIFNGAASELFGWSAEEVTGLSLDLLLPDPDDCEQPRLILPGEWPHATGALGEHELVRKDGTGLTADIAISKVGMGNVARYIAIIRDTSARRRDEESIIRRQEKLIEASRLTTMGEMAAAMAHELNQPLTAIANYASACDRLLTNGTAIAEVQRSLKQIEDQAHRAAEVIRRLREFVKHDGALREKERISPADLIREIIPLAQIDAKANNIRLEFDVADDLPVLNINCLQVQQVILNLIRNGIDAMADCDAERRRLSVRGLRNDSGAVVFEVSDRGAGVPDRIHDEIFHAFVTTKPEGMGMGLAICKAIVRSHRGTLGFRNNGHGGATFFVEVPVQSAES